MMPPFLFHGKEFVWFGDFYLGLNDVVDSGL